MINLYALTETAAFGVAIALLMFSLAKLIADKLKTPVANPLMISVIFILIFYWAFRIPVKNFDTGGDVIYMSSACHSRSCGFNVPQERAYKEKSYPYSRRVRCWGCGFCWRSFNSL